MGFEPKPVDREAKAISTLDCLDRPIRENSGQIAVRILVYAVTARLVCKPKRERKEEGISKRVIFYSCNIHIPYTLS